MGWRGDEHGHLQRRAVGFVILLLLALGCHYAGVRTDIAPSPSRVRIETTQGAFVVELVREWAPRGVDRFYELVRAGYYNDSRFSRVVPGFIAQFGIAGDPRVSARWKDAAIADDSVRASNVRGAIAFAMTGPNTRTTQVFINLVDNVRLDAQGFAPIGRVVEGMDVVDRLYSGYGENAGGGMRAGRQGPVFAEGNAYLDREFPKLDRLIKAAVLDSVNDVGEASRNSPGKPH